LINPAFGLRYDGVFRHARLIFFVPEFYMGPGQIADDVLVPAGLFLLWSVLGGVIIAAFFVAAFFGDFGPIRFGDPGVVILFLPVFTAFILGLLLVDFELVQTVLAALLATGIAI